jgi:hypothetical protein
MNLFKEGLYISYTSLAPIHPHPPPTIITIATNANTLSPVVKRERSKSARERQICEREMSRGEREAV